MDAVLLRNLNVFSPLLLRVPRSSHRGFKATEIWVSCTDVESRPDWMSRSQFTYPRERKQGPVPVYYSIRQLPDRLGIPVEDCTMMIVEPRTEHRMEFVKAMLDGAAAPVLRGIENRSVAWAGSPDCHPGLYVFQAWQIA
jgi:hypothetical protein